ncbi:hypothetical protein ACFVXE_02785, partial [Streptomyces sp. NPDC058231]|uniref:hypothetical protein n=1 Tax=Streptomyces sp. NPDC058231 TaxID=3346392 RepID=UPI0036E7AF12
LTLSGFPPGFPFGLAFPTLSDSFVSDSRSKRPPAEQENFYCAFQLLAFAIPFPAIPTLPDSLFVPFPVRIMIPVAFGLAFAFRLFHHASRFPRQLIIEPMSSNYGMPNSHPSG